MIDNQLQGLDEHSQDTLRPAESQTGHDKTGAGATRKVHTAHLVPEIQCSATRFLESLQNVQVVFQPGDLRHQL